MDEKINLKQGYLAMYEFVKSYYLRNGKPDEIGLFLSDAQVQPSGYIGDPASWQDWLDAVEKVLKTPNIDDFRT